MRVAIIGSGVSGLVCASRLHGRHDVQVFEKDEWIGGHTHTVDVEIEGRRHAVDTGFIVFNDRNYPHFSALLEKLAVASQPTRMTFGFSSEQTGLEYSGSSVSGLFAQRRNLFRPAHWKMLAEALRFFRLARALLSAADGSISLGEFLDRHRFTHDFQTEHLLPMGAAIWSSPPSRIRDFPALSFARFFENHGLLSLRDRPQWRVVKGGSARYVEALCAPFQDRIRLNTRVRSLRRIARKVEVALPEDRCETFDAVVLACHSDQALALLSDPTAAEKDTLGAVSYQKNHVSLHTDASLLPDNPRARAAWNYRVHRSGRDQATLTYFMNPLQGLDCTTPLLVTLNSPDSIRDSKVRAEFEYSHPLYDAGALDAQRRGAELALDLNTAYCGAYWGNGFHEDGVRSGMLAAENVELMVR